MLLSYEKNPRAVVWNISNLPDTSQAPLPKAVEDVVQIPHLLLMCGKNFHTL